MKKNLLCVAIAALSPLCIFNANAAIQDSNLPVNNLNSGVNLDTIVVTASQQPVPLRQVAASVSVVTEEDIQAIGSSSVSDILRATPGINVSGNGGAGKSTTLRIRGEEGYRTLVLIDGLNISDPSATQIGPRFDDLMSASIEKIEILRGPQGMMYGADAGGIVNITTRRAHEPFAVDIATEYGRYGTSNTVGNVRGKNNIADYSLSVSHFDTDGFNARTGDTPQKLHDTDGYTNTTYHFTGGIDINNELRIEATVRDSNALNEYDSSPFTSRLTNGYDLTAYQIAAIYDTEKFSQKVSVQTMNSQREFFTNGVSNVLYDGDYEQAQYTGVLRFLSAGDIVYGIDSKQEKMQQHGESATERDQLGYYAEWQGKIGQQFFYTAGARQDDNDDFGNHTSYRASAAYLIDVFNGDTLKFKSSYGTGFRAPSLYEVAYNKGPFAAPPASTTTLKEETSKGLDAGFEYHWKDAGYIEVVYFNQKVSDAIDFDLAGFTGYLQEPGNSYSRGIEMSGVYPINDDFRLLGNYTYNDTEDPSDKRRSRRPRHVANVGFDLNPGIKNVSIYTNLRVVKDTEDKSSSTRYELDDYSALSATINWAVNQQIDLYVRGENLLDDDYEEVTGYNTAKASIFGGFRYHFR